MPSFEVPVGVQSELYIGDYAASSTVLVPIGAQRTSGIQIVEDSPRTYIRALDTYEFTGPHKITLTATFLAENDTVWKVARGIALTGSINDAPANNHYVLYLVYSSDTIKKTYYFPKMCILSALEVPYGKDRVTAIRITFGLETPNYSTVLMKRGTPTTLAADLGVRDPLA